MMQSAAMRCGCALLAIWAVAAGCHALSRRPPWGEEPVEASREAGTASCDTCHAEVVARYAAGPHGRKSIACGQCHRGGSHPNFEGTPNDATCGGCHLPEYQQVGRSAHARRAIEVPAAISAGTLRDDGFRVALAEGVVFTIRGTPPQQNGLLCIGCHYEKHRLSASSARSSRFCESCHADRDTHYRDFVSDDNRCLICHMQQAVTVVGQIVTSHEFPGSAGSGR